ncbi:MAG: 4-hydroxybenzoate octaprenyltransferase [Candidatus Sedimenticola sp. (ex Thyasira tokunagai)]
MIKEQGTRAEFNPGSPSLKRRLLNYARLVRLDRPIGILLLLWPAMWALWIAGEGRPPWDVLVVFILGVTLMRSAGCAINDYADRNFDGKVERTCNRPIVTGDVSPKEALGVFAVLVLLSFGLVLLLNIQTILMSFVALLLAASYPFMKRYTHLPQMVLGMAFGIAVPMAFTALTETVAPVGWLLYLATVIWAMIYDTQYAMVDRDDDIKIGVKSTAILFGRYDLLVISLMQLFMIALLLLIGVKVDLGPYYYIAVLFAALLFAYQHMLIRRRDPAGCFSAFLNNNIFGIVVFVGLLVDYLM